MLALFLFSLSIAGLFFVERLRSVQKEARSSLRLYQLQGSIMNFMRDEGANISQSDYQKARKMLEINTHLIAVYACQRPSSFHIRTFISFVNTMARPVYDMDRQILAFRPDNEQLQQLQVNLAGRIRWSVVYNTPVYIILLMSFSVFTVMASLFAMKRTRTFYQWYKKAVAEEVSGWLGAKYSRFGIHP